MKHVARNLCQHENGVYYAKFDGVPKSLKTDKKGEAMQMLREIRRKRVVSSLSKGPLDTTPPQGPTVTATTPSGDLAALHSVIAALSAQVAQQSVMIAQIHQEKANPDALPPGAPTFEAFIAKNLHTICSTVADDTQRMYQGTAKRLTYALRVHQRYERMKQFAKSGRSLEPSLWQVLRDLGPGARGLGLLVPPQGTRQQQLESTAMLSEGIH